MKTFAALAFSVLALAAGPPALAQSATELAALRGLAPVATLPNTPEGVAALAANLAVTAGIQTGERVPPLLLPFPEQRLLALRDSFITDGNATELADGLGTKLGGAYQAKIRYEDYKTFGSVSQAVADLIGYTNHTARSDSNSGKFFFANATRNGKEPVSPEAAAILSGRHGTPDVFGRAYGRPAGSPGADAFGNSRPFQTAPLVVGYRGDDYFGRPSHNLDWLRGPSQNLTDSPAYPSGHTTYGYTESVLLALLVPERYQEMIARGAEYGTNRIVVGAHYAMDVIGGRALALYDLAHLLANDPAYVGRSLKNPAIIGETAKTSTPITITDYPAALATARVEFRAFLEAGCGGTVAACAAADEGRFKDPARVKAMYDATQTYGLPVVHPEVAAGTADVGRLAPEAGHLLTAAFPSLSLDEANAILTATLGPGGGFLDDGSAFGIYSRLDLYAAAGQAARRAAGR